MPLTEACRDIDLFSSVAFCSPDGFAKKVKPLHRFTEWEIAAYAVIHHVDYVVDECPMAKGSKMFAYQQVLNQPEAESPGTKHTFYLKFLDRQATQRQEDSRTITEQDQRRLHPCETCGQPTSTTVCTFCKIMAKAGSHA